MGFIGVILLVIFVIVCLIIIALVLLQNEEGDGLGGLFAGGSNTAFGSRSATVLTKITYGAVFLFFVTAFFLALANKSPSDKGLEQEAQMQRAVDTEWWDEGQETLPAEDAESVEDADASVPSAEAPAAASDAGDSVQAE